MSERSIGLLEAEMIINPKGYNVKIYLTIYIYIHTYTYIYINIVKVSQNNFSCMITSHISKGLSLNLV